MRHAALLCVISLTGLAASAAEPLRVGRFDVDATPPIGSTLAYDVLTAVDTPLSCRGVVLVGAEQPIVLCAVDWIGISNDAHRTFREALAQAAGTAPERVAVHTLHQHDAPWCDFAADALASQLGVEPLIFDSAFARELLRRAAEAVRAATAGAQPVTHLGLAEAAVEKVASNRRILGVDGKVQHVRFTATKDPAVRAFPEGVIDPKLRSISFWNGEHPVAELTYYATHPQSYYRTGRATPDFPGLARNARQQATGVFKVHFNGAGGNIGAGKYNDGAHENRQILADRVAAAMAQAWEHTRKIPISTADVSWRFTAVALPPSAVLDEQKLLAQLQDSARPVARDRLSTACHLVWKRRCQAGEMIDVSCLGLGPCRVLHMPGELFVEYQLAAAAMRPDLFVAMAAYGDYGPWYIGTEIAYQQGGYETGADASLVGPGSERVLVDALKSLLDVPDRPSEPLGVAAARREVDEALAREAAAK